MPTSDIAQSLEAFLRELLGAKKALKLYPAGNPRAAEWIQRLHRALEAARQAGLPPVVRIANARFEWDGGALTTRDPTLDAFRFELETRRISEITIHPEVEPRELRDLLECLNLAPEAVEAVGGLPALLAARDVTHITLRGLFWEGRGGTEPGGVVGVAAPARERVDAFIAALMARLEAELRELTYDRPRLVSWLLGLAGPAGRADALFAAIETLVPLLEAERDRELRYRVLAEALVTLPDPLMTSLATQWLLPRAWIPDVLALLTRFSGDELATLTRHVEPGLLAELRANLREMPADDWRKARLQESLEDALATREPPPAPPEPPIAGDDPALVRLEAIAREACTPQAILAHSVDVLLQLLTARDGGYPAFLADALEEAIAEALARDQLRLALRVLRTLGNTDRLRPDWITDHQRQLHLAQRRLSTRSHVAPLAEVVRRADRPEDVREAGEYLALLGREAIEEFVAILVDEADGTIRGRMFDVLATLGPTVLPAVRPWVGDRRWAVTRQVVAFLGRLGDPSAFAAVETVARHEHPQVRREVARTLALLGGRQAMRHLLGYLQDPDAEVRLAAIRLLGTFMDASLVGPLQNLLATPTRAVPDLLVKREITTALAAVGTPEAREVLEAIASRRLWPWQRNELKVRGLAQEALRTMPRPEARPPEPDRG